MWTWYCMSPVFIREKKNNWILHPHPHSSVGLISIYGLLCQILQRSYINRFSNHQILCENNLKGLDEVLVWRSFSHSSNLFISSATVGDFYGYSHNMPAPPVIFSTVMQAWKISILHIEVQHVLCHVVLKLQSHNGFRVVFFLSCVQYVLLLLSCTA